MSSLRITEIFYSLQGESSSVGIPTVFIRLTGCPLRCSYCDTDYAFTGGEKKEISAIIAEVESYKTRYVTVTGGEPLAQPAHEQVGGRSVQGYVRHDGVGGEVVELERRRFVAGSTDEDDVPIRWITVDPVVLSCRVGSQVMVLRGGVVPMKSTVNQLGVGVELVGLRA